MGGTTTPQTEASQATMLSHRLGLTALPARIVGSWIAAASAVTLASCAGNSGATPALPPGAVGAAVPLLAGAGPTRAARRKGGVSFHILVPKQAQKSALFTAPGTRGIAIASRLQGQSSGKPVFFAIGQHAKHCSAGSGSTAFVCALSVTVAAGRERFDLRAYGAGSTHAVLLARAAVTQNIAAQSNQSVTPHWSAASQTSPSPSPSPSASPSSAPGSPVTAQPPNVAICPSSGSGKCENDAARTTIAQSGGSGSFSVTDGCPANVAAIALASTSGTSATYTITGQSASGTCTIAFTGSGGAQVSVHVEVTAGGIGINAARPH
jgi:hypothetical protein